MCGPRNAAVALRSLTRVSCRYIAKEQHQVQKYREALELAARERAYQIRNAQAVYEAEVAQAEKDLILDR